MKTIITAILFVFSFSAFASEPGVLEAMQSMFREGFYFGFNAQGTPCTLQVKFLEDRAVVTAYQGNSKITRVIVDGTGYRFNLGKRELLSSDNSGTFRTLAIDNVMTYTVTAERLADGSERFIECPTNTVE